MTIKKGFKVEKPRAFDPREQSGVDPRKPFCFDPEDHGVYCATRTFLP